MVFRIATIGISTLTLMVVARLLGPAAYGPYAAAAALFVLPQAAGLLGGDQLFLSGRIDPGTLRRLAARVSLITGSIGLLIALAHPSLSDTARLTLALLSVSGTAEMTRLPWLLEPQRKERFSQRGRREFLARATVSIATVAAALLGLSAVGLAGFAAAMNLTLTLAWRLSREEVEPADSQRRLRSMLRSGAPFTASSILYTAYVTMPMVVVSSITTETDTAFFRTAGFILLIGYVLPAALNGEVLRSQLYNLRAGRRDTPVSISHYLAANLVLGGLMALSTWLVLGRLMEILLGPAYDGIGDLATILALSLPFNFVNSLMGNVLIAGGHIISIVKIQAATLAFSLVSVPALAISHGVVGASWSLLGCELFAGVLSAFTYVHLHNRNPQLTEDASRR